MKFSWPCTCVLGVDPGQDKMSQRWIQRTSLTDRKALLGIFCDFCEAKRHIGITLSGIILSLSVFVFVGESHFIGSHMSHISQATHALLGMLPLWLWFRSDIPRGGYRAGKTRSLRGFSFDEILLQTIVGNPRSLNVAQCSAIERGFPTMPSD